MNLLPLCTATVCPTNSGEMVDARAQVFTTFFSPDAFMTSTFRRSLSSMYGPFLILRAMVRSPYDFVALPRLRPRTMNLFERFVRFLVFFPSRVPHGDTGGRPPDVRPS